MVLEVDGLWPIFFCDALLMFGSEANLLWTESGVYYKELKEPSALMINSLGEAAGIFNLGEFKPR